MLERSSLIGLAFSVVLLILDFYLLRERKIRGKAFVFWLMIGATVGLLSVVPSLISLFDLVFGTQFTVSALLATVFMFFLLALFYFHYRLNELQSMITKLAMEMSVRKYPRGSNPHNTKREASGKSSHEEKS